MPLEQSVVLANLALLLCLTLVGFSVSRIARRNDIADIFWGLGFVAFAILNYELAETPGLRAKLVGLMLVLWGLRLSWYIGTRSLGKSEDVRYQNMRANWKTHEALQSFLKVFCLQSILLFIIALPVILLLHENDSQLSPWDFTGLSLFILGFLFEGTADAEMRAFKLEPTNKGKVLANGMWSLSRHPNYFGEILIWWGIFFLSLATKAGPYLVFSPVLISFLLLKVSGVPLLESTMAKKGAEYLNYLKRTPSLLPFNYKSLFVFFFIMLSLMILDFCWLGFIAKDFYHAESKLFTDDPSGTSTMIWWAAIAVYIFLALGVKFFCVDSAKSKLDAQFRGVVLGLFSYSLYEYTNLALLKNWPVRMALIDIAWGCVLCGLGARAGKWIAETLKI